MTTNSGWRFRGSRECRFRALLPVLAFGFLLGFAPLDAEPDLETTIKEAVLKKVSDSEIASASLWIDVFKDSGSIEGHLAPRKVVHFPNDVVTDLKRVTSKPRFESNVNHFMTDEPEFVLVVTTKESGSFGLHHSPRDSPGFFRLVFVKTDPTPLVTGRLIWYSFFRDGVAGKEDHFGIKLDDLKGSRLEGFVREELSKYDP